MRLGTCAILVVAAFLWMGQRCAADYRMEAYDPSTMQFPLTPEQGKTAARNWAGNASLDLTLEAVYRNVDGFQAAAYVLHSPDGQRFEVNCYTGGVAAWRSAPAIAALVEHRRQDKESPLARLTQAQIDRNRSPGWLRQ